MKITIMETRDTSVGTFKQGITYDVDMKRHKVKKSVDEMLKTGAAIKAADSKSDKKTTGNKD